MNNQPTEDGSTVLERWKALARIENSRARENWDAQETNVQSDLIGDIGDSENKTVRKRRDAQIKARSDAGMSAKEICSRTGLGNTTIYRVLGVRRPRARAENNPSEDKAGTARDANADVSRA